MALTYIDGIERELEQNDTDSVEFQDQYKERLKSLLTEIHDNYMAEMCKGATTQSPPESIRTKDITVTMIKTELSKGSEEKFVFDQRERSLFEASNVKLMDGVYNKYSQWDCGQGEDLPCVGLCLGTAVLESDLVTPTSDRLDISTPPRVSKIHDIRLLNPASGADMTKQIQGETLEEPINIQLNVENTTKRSGYEFKVREREDKAQPLIDPPLLPPVPRVPGGQLDGGPLQHHRHLALHCWGRDGSDQLRVLGARLHRGVPHPGQRPPRNHAQHARSEQNNQIHVRTFFLSALKYFQFIIIFSLSGSRRTTTRLSARGRRLSRKTCRNSWRRS